MNTSPTTQSVTGALTFETVPGLYQNSSNWFAGAGDLTIDLAQVERTDSAGLALLIEWLRRAEPRISCVCNIPTQVQTLIRIAARTLLNSSS
jgi:phospholipid transport system transporter-binding protein